MDQLLWPHIGMKCTELIKLIQQQPQWICVCTLTCIRNPAPLRYDWQDGNVIFPSTPLLVLSYMIIAWSVVHKTFDQLLLLVMIINKSCKWAIDPASCARRGAKQNLQCMCVEFLYRLISPVPLAAAWKLGARRHVCCRAGDKVVVAPQLLMSRRSKLQSQLCVQL